MTEPINQCQLIISAWHEYLVIMVNTKHSYIYPLKGTAAGQSLGHAVSEGPFVHFGVLYCPQLTSLFFSPFVFHLLHLGVQSKHADVTVACGFFPLFLTTVLNA